MRASRLLSILMLLQARGRLSAATLAAELEVSVRTVYRDVDELSASGVPIYAERGRDGGFQLLDGWRTRLTGLTVAEAQALFLAGLPGPLAELGLGEAAAAAQRKLLAALPAGWQADARRVAERVHLDPVDWYRVAQPAGPLRAVAEAVWTEQRLAIRYDSWARVVDRLIEPLGVVLKGGTWYVAASVGGGPPRTYRLPSILALHPTGERFPRPPRFDLAAYWAEATARFEADRFRGTAVLRASATGLARLGRLDPALADAVQHSAAPEPGGWTRVRIPIESVDHAAQMLLALGAEAEVLAPAALRRTLAETAAALASLYADGQSKKSASPSDR